MFPNSIIKNINKNKIAYLILVLKVLIVIIILFFCNINISKIVFIFSNLKLEYEYKKIENYLNLCNNNKNIEIKKYKKIKNPKVSIISPVFNREKYLLRFIKSIYYQNFYDIEIIFIDDCSTDNSLNMIEDFQKRDKRILLIKNKRNKGTFINKNLGILYSEGKYIICPDPDDILSKNNLNILFDFAEKHDYEIIRYILYLRDEKNSFKNKVENLEIRPVYQPKLSTYLFYGNKELQTIDCYISNKFIKRAVYIKVLNSIKNICLNLYMIFMEDSLINFLLYRTANSYFFLKRIKYYYIKNSDSITNNLYKISDLRIQFLFIYLKILFEYSKNNKFEKDMANVLFTNVIRRFNIRKNMKSNNNIYNFVYNFFILIIKKYLNNKYIYEDIKLILKELRVLINNIKKI